jgi:hypothetical protein
MCHWRTKMMIHMSDHHEKNISWVVMNIGRVSYFLNNVNIVYMILSVRIDRFVIVGNLCIMFWNYFKHFGVCIIYVWGWVALFMLIHRFISYCFVFMAWCVLISHNDRLCVYEVRIMSACDCLWVYVIVYEFKYENNILDIRYF